MPLTALLAVEGFDSSGITTAIEGVATNLSSTATSIIPVAMGVGGVILIATLGWRLIKRFIK